MKELVRTIIKLHEAGELEKATRDRLLVFLRPHEITISRPKTELLKLTTKFLEENDGDLTSVSSFSVS